MSPEREIDTGFLPSWLARAKMMSSYMSVRATSEASGELSEGITRVGDDQADRVDVVVRQDMWMRERGRKTYILKRIFLGLWEEEVYRWEDY
jgi:hypothetical protein